MAARPQILQLLRNGLFLTRKAFPWFVPTWNWLVEAFDGFCGDADLNPLQGHIHVDRTNPAKPVIRLVNANFGGGGKGIEDIRLSSDGTYIQALINGEWVNKIPTIPHSEV